MELIPALTRERKDVAQPTRLHELSEVGQGTRLELRACEIRPVELRTAEVGAAEVDVVAYAKEAVPTAFKEKLARFERGWKIVQMRRPLGTGGWRLYRLDRDPSELYDKAGAEPELLKQLAREWDAYASTHNVVVVQDEESSASR